MVTKKQRRLYIPDAELTQDNPAVHLVLLHEILIPPYDVGRFLKAADREAIGTEQPEMLEEFMNVGAAERVYTSFIRSLMQTNGTISPHMAAAATITAEWQKDDDSEVVTKEVALRQPIVARTFVLDNMSSIQRTAVLAHEVDHDHKFKDPEAQALEAAFAEENGPIHPDAKYAAYLEKSAYKVTGIIVGNLISDGITLRDVVHDIRSKTPQEAGAYIRKQRKELKSSLGVSILGARAIEVVFGDGTPIPADEEVVALYAAKHIGHDPKEKRQKEE